MELFKGHYSAKDAEEIIDKMVKINIEFHEKKINQSDQEEDIKMREKRIRELQAHHAQLKSDLILSRKNVELATNIEVSVKCN